MTFPTLDPEQPRRWKRRSPPCRRRWTPCPKGMKPALRWRKSWPPYRRPSLKNPCSILGPDVSAWPSNPDQARGFDWRTDVALIGGIAAKEAIVSTLGTAYSLGDIDPEDPTPLAQQIRNDGRWTPATALALLVFVLLYAPVW